MTPHDRLSRSLGGVTVVTVTPFQPDYELDLDGLRSNVEWLATSGIDAITSCGGTGEYLSLTATEVSAVTQATVSASNGRLPVIGGVGSSLPDAVALARRVANDGVDAILVHHRYQPYVSETGLLAYYRSVARATTLPTVLYVRSPLLDFAAFASLASERNIVGMKYAVDDLRLVAELADTIPKRLGWAFVCGTAEMRAEAYWRLGARGFTSGIANLAPTLSMCLCDALKNGDGNQISRYRKQAEPLERLRTENGGAYNIAAVKEAMGLCGLAAGPIRPPGADLPDELRPFVRRFVQSCQQHAAAQPIDVPVMPSAGRGQQP